MSKSSQSIIDASFCQAVVAGRAKDFLRTGRCPLSLHSAIIGAGQRSSGVEQRFRNDEPNIQSYPIIYRLIRSYIGDFLRLAHITTVRTTAKERHGERQKRGIFGDNSPAYQKRYTSDHIKQAIVFLVS
ncbi:hypothetical protein ACFLXL_03210 [Chloroflexota bacterium]